METLGRAADLANSALTMMRDKGIPPNPGNFHIWYNYFSGQDPDLRRTLDVMLGNNQEFTERRNHEIYEKFFSFSQEGAAIESAATMAETELNRIMKYLGLAGSNVTEYGQVLKEFSGSIDQDVSSEDLKEAIDGALFATREMEQKNKNLEEKFNASSREIGRLREDLESMRQEAMTDGLTGIANRKLFDAELRRAAMDGMENGDPLSLLMIDIDFFKKFNDSYGHQTGDQVLKLLSSTLISSIKGQDTAARYGGEEFSVILPGTGIEGGIKVAETIRNGIARKQVINRKTGDTLGQITVSIGVGVFEYGEPLSQLISRADKALYVAKRTGRNKVNSQFDKEYAELTFDD